MTTFLFLLGVVILVCAGLSIYWSVRSYRRYKLNLMLTEELSAIVVEAKDTINNRILEGDPMSSPQMLSTIVTVLVHKFGDVRLSMSDFMISDDEYVSVYVDGKTKEILLSLNHDLVQEDNLKNGLLAFGKSDDTTFH